VNQVFAANPTRGRPDPVYGDYQPVGHLAQDYTANTGDPVFAAASGTVVYSGWGQNMPEHIALRWGYAPGAAGWASGIITIIDHGDGVGTAYSHQSGTNVRAGQWVHGGQVIGAAGSTGRSTGPHVHFEVIVTPVNYASLFYSRIDPEPLFAGGLSTVGGTDRPLLIPGVPKLYADE